MSWLHVATAAVTCLLGCNSSSGDACNMPGPGNEVQCCVAEGPASTATCFYCAKFAGGQCTEVVNAPPCTCPTGLYCEAIGALGSADAARGSLQPALAVCQ